MIPIETYYSNIIFSAEGCKNLPGTSIHNEDGLDEIETCWILYWQQVQSQRHCCSCDSQSRIQSQVLLYRFRKRSGRFLRDSAGAASHQ